MKRFTLALLLLATCAVARALDSPEWQEFHPPDHSFTVKFPIKPEQRQNDAHGGLWVATDRVSGVFEAGYSVDKKNPTEVERAKTVSEAINAFRKELNMRERGRTPTFVQGCPGTEVTGTMVLTSNGRRITLPAIARVFYVNNGRVYFLVVAGDFEPGQDDRFFASFHMAGLP